MSVENHATPDHEPRHGQPGKTPDAAVAKTSGLPDARAASTSEEPPVRQASAAWVVAVLALAVVMAWLLPTLADALHAERTLEQDTLLPLASADLTVPAGWSVDPASIGPVEVALARDGIAVDVVSGSWQGMTDALLERLEDLYLGGEPLAWEPDGVGALDDMLDSPRAVWRAETSVADGPPVAVAVVRQSASVVLVASSAQGDADVLEEQLQAAVEAILKGVALFEPGLGLDDAGQGALR